LRQNSLSTNGWNRPELEFAGAPASEQAAASGDRCVAGQTTKLGQGTSEIIG